MRLDRKKHIELRLQNFVSSNWLLPVGCPLRRTATRNGSQIVGKFAEIKMCASAILFRVFEYRVQIRWQHHMKGSQLS